MTIEQPKRRAVVYARTANTDQTGNNSLYDQEQRCRRYCGKNGLDVTKVFHDSGISGRTLNRKGLNQALDFLKNHEHSIDTLVVTNPTRLSRDFAILKTLEIEIARNLTLPIKLVCVDHTQETRLQPGTSSLPARL